MRTGPGSRIAQRGVGHWSRPGLSLEAAVPNLFGTRDRFRGRQFFHG